MAGRQPEMASVALGNRTMNWHRLFGLALRDLSADSPFAVAIEVDLSAKKPLLDLVIVCKTGGEFAGRLPDGLDQLANFNLITFKSFWQPLDDWAVKELLGRYVNYRKFVSTSLDHLLPEEQFRLFAVCARFPQGLDSRVARNVRQEGVYDCRWGTDDIRIVVMSRISTHNHNALVNLYSGQVERIQYGAGARPSPFSRHQLLNRIAIRALPIGGFQRAIHDGRNRARIRKGTPFQTHRR